MLAHRLARFTFVIAGMLLPFFKEVSARILFAYDGTIFEREQFSSIISLLEEMESAVSFADFTKNLPELLSNDDLLFQNVVLLTNNFPSRLPPIAIIKYVEAGGNLIWATDEQASQQARELAKQFGVEISAPAMTAFDFTTNASKDPRAILTNQLVDEVSAKQILGAEMTSQRPLLLYRGTGLRMTASSSLTFPLISGRDTAAICPINPNYGTCSAYGTDVLFIGALQALNNARIIISGSIDMFTNKFIATKLKTKSKGETVVDNLSFLKELFKWTFQQRSALRIDSFSHGPLGESTKFDADVRSEYRINDEMDIKLCISERSNDTIIPFLPNDLQIELIMMQPYLRVTLVPDPAKKCLITTVKLPEKYGVYKLNLDYKRHGLSYLQKRAKVVVKPFRYDEHVWFKKIAYPYYLNWLLGLVASLALIIVMLFGLISHKTGADKIVKIE